MGASEVLVDTSVALSQLECPDSLATRIASSMEAVTVYITGNPEVAAHTPQKQLLRGKQPRSQKSIRDTFGN